MSFRSQERQATPSSESSVDMQPEHSEQGVIDRILVAYDGSDLSREAFAYAAMLATAVGCRIHLLHVLECEPSPRPTSIMSRTGAMLDAPAIVGTPGADALGDETARLSQQLDELAAYCRLRKIAVEKEMATGDLIAALGERAGTRDLIVLGLKGRFARVGPGSTTKGLAP